MKLTRSAVAIAAAALVAAGSVPAVHHLAADGDASKPVTTLDPAVSVVDSTIAAPTSTEEAPKPSVADATPSSEAPAVATTTEVTVVDEVFADEDPAKLASDPVDGENPEVQGSELTSVPEEPVGHPGIKPLQEAPKTYKGVDQRWVSIMEQNKDVWKNEAISVHSPSMDRDIPVAIFHATDENGQLVDNAPTVYLLNGAGGSEQDSDWIAQAFRQMFDTYGRAGVNVVVPQEGAFSYYVDWAAAPPVKNTFYKGKQMWSTFLAHELPQAVEPYMNADQDHRAVAGLSMAATSVLLLAEHNPGFYDAVGSFSGCAATSTPLPWEFVNLTVDRGAPGVMTPEYIFGERGSDYNRYNDALVNAAKLKGTAVYLSTGTGLAGETDTAGYLKDRLVKLGVAESEASSRAFANAMTLQVEGGVIEAAMNACTHDLMVKMRANDVEVNHAELRNVGTHSWGSWRDDLKLSYDKVFKQALGLEK